MLCKVQTILLMYLRRYFLQIASAGTLHGAVAYPDPPDQYTAEQVLRLNRFARLFDSNSYARPGTRPRNLEVDAALSWYQRPSALVGRKEESE